MKKGRVINVSNSNFTPLPERVLVTTAPRDIYENGSCNNRIPALTDDGYLDGFAEYCTHIPMEWKFSTKQKDYGLAFLEANVPGPKFLHYPTNSNILEHLENGNFDVLCISAFTWSLPWAIELAKQAKLLYNIKEVWLGGYSVMTDEPEIYKVFDRIFWGYCENLLRLSIGLDSLLHSTIIHPDLITPANWLGRKTQTGHIIFRRGCSNKCTYCADPVFEPGGDLPLSTKAIETILDQYKQKGIRSVYISNQETNMFNGIGQEVLSLIKARGMNFGMLTSFKALVASGEKGINELRDNGLSFLLVGLESLNDKNLIKTQRTTNQKFMERILNLLKRLNISVTSTYMICFEDDTEQSIREAKKKIIDLGITISLFNITTPLPGTPMYFDYKEKNLIWDWNWSHWTGNHLVWKHPVICPDKARELLAELRSEVNSPIYNPYLMQQWNNNSKEQQSLV
ncbi:MAG: radical SAM protein [Dethiobacter sp.]|nr:radical SAM protein [Dethiobacter sp.]MCL4462941.1 radical SAM protein [Bacillota bacterium]